MSHRLMVSQITDVYRLNEIEHIFRYIIYFTLLAECSGAVLLTASFLLEGEPFYSAVYNGVFHAVSAFCNAGFSIFDSSLIGMNPWAKVVIMVLIIGGGIGFYVIYDLHSYIRKKRLLKVHTKLVLVTSLLLIFFGALIFTILEHEMTILDGLFQSVSARTAGFNSVDLTGLSNISKFTLVVLMIIGASPGGTGGGIKTSVFALALLSIYHVISGKYSVVIFKREVAFKTILRAFSLIALYIFLLVIGTLSMLYFYNDAFIDMLFEVASALGTVGLTLGVTTKVGTAGKWILMLCMFIGRIGPAAFILSIIGKEKKQVIRYPEEKVILG